MAEIITALVGVATVLFTLYTWLLARNASIYATFDALYQDVLKLGLEYPICRDPTKTITYKKGLLDEKELVRYETYAFMVMNVCETIADSLDLYPTSNRRPDDVNRRPDDANRRPDDANRRPHAIERLVRWSMPPIAARERLKLTWEPVLRAEARLHASWIERCEAGVQFKKDFLDLMKEYGSEQIAARQT